MHIEIHPKVEGRAAERLLDFAAVLAQVESGEVSRVSALVEREAAWARRLRAEAEAGWRALQCRFEEQLLGPALP